MLRKGQKNNHTKVKIRLSQNREILVQFNFSQKDKILDNRRIGTIHYGENEAKIVQRKRGQNSCGAKIAVA